MNARYVVRTQRTRLACASGLAAVILICAQITLAAADFSVSTPNSQFAFAISSNGVALGNSPTLVLVRGRTYTFSVNTTCGFHPFRVNSAGASNNVICSGTLTYIVPTNAQNYTYDCGFHGASMQGQIVTVAPPPPPTPPVPKIISFTIGTNIMLRSAPTTNTFTLFPEYKTNLNSSNWVALSVLSNRFLNGTSETFCGRPPGTNVFIRLRAGPSI
jgi:hypothetical protein